MKKFILALPLLAASTFAQNVLAASDYPTNGIYQEMAGTANNGEISIDLYNSTNYRSTVRVGMFGGEIIYSPDVLVDPILGNTAPMMGFKYPINKNMAAYGMLNFDSAADTDLLFGFSYSGGNRDFLYNGNAEIIAPGAAGAENTVRVKGGAYYAISSRGVGRMYLAGEIVIDTNADTTDLYAAMRFSPKKNVNVDIGVYESIDAANVSTTGVPIFFRLTLGI